MGEVADVRSGESKSTLKPTWFDYLTANYGLSTLWTAVIYCFGVSLTFMKFWRRKYEQVERSPNHVQGSDLRQTRRYRIYVSLFDEFMRRIIPGNVRKD